MKKKIYLGAVLILIMTAAAGLWIYRSTNSGIVVTQYADQTGNQAVFYTIEAGDALYVVDGGWADNADYVRQIIMEKGGVVEGWILTHPHPDHIGAFNAIYPVADDLRIRQIYAVDMDYLLYEQYAREWDEFAVYDTFCTYMGDSDKIQYLHTGDTLSLQGMELTVFSAFDEETLQYSTDLANQGSMVFQIAGRKESMLFSSDVYGPAMCDRIMTQWGDELKSDYMQMGHHGNNSVTHEFITHVNPKTVFFDAPFWLINGPNYDTRDNMDFVTMNGMEVYTYTTAPNTIMMK